MSLDVARQFGRTLTARMDTTAPRDGDMPEGLKFFVAGDGFTRNLDAGTRNDEYRSSGVGVTAGAEYGFGSGVVGPCRQLFQAEGEFRQRHRGHGKQLAPARRLWRVRDRGRLHPGLCRLWLERA